MQTNGWQSLEHRVHIKQLPGGGGAPSAARLWRCLLQDTAGPRAPAAETEAVGAASCWNAKAEFEF